MKNLIIVFAFLLIIFCFYSCATSPLDGGITGPCVHEYKEAVFHITSLTDSADQKNIQFAKISNLKINGREQYSYLALIDSYGIVFVDSLYYCNFPCGLGHESGTYEFTIFAEGYKEKNVKFENINYSFYKGGCPSYNTGGTRVSIKLSKDVPYFSGH